ncbi:MAG: aminotransferase class III-fold pyridoxal phosphate-dependent enzyme, partial [Alphaproteobacteria bacterium]
MSSWTDRAQVVLPGGGFGNFDPSLVIKNGQGSRVWDVEGNEYIDYLIGSGPMLLGHGHPEVVDAIEKQLRDGFTFFANNPQGIELAERICEAVPCAEQLRYVSTGGEADMFAIRLARAHTGRDLIIKFEGGYHGMSDEGQMSLSPSELRPFPEAEPDSAGILEKAREGVLIAAWNDPAQLDALFAEHGQRIAAIIAEPLQRI